MVLWEHVISFMTYGTVNRHNHFLFYFFLILVIKPKEVKEKSFVFQV